MCQRFVYLIIALTTSSFAMQNSSSQSHYPTEVDANVPIFVRIIVTNTHDQWEVYNLCILTLMAHHILLIHSTLPFYKLQYDWENEILGFRCIIVLIALKHSTFYIHHTSTWNIHTTISEIEVRLEFVWLIRKKEEMVAIF